jgi:hypothetical protein
LRRIAAPGGGEGADEEMGLQLDDPINC